MEITYLNEKHRQYSEACQKEVREMMEHPLSREEKEEQMRLSKSGNPEGFPHQRFTKSSRNRCIDSP